MPESFKGFPFIIISFLLFQSINSNAAVKNDSLSIKADSILCLPGRCIKDNSIQSLITSDSSPCIAYYDGGVIDYKCTDNGLYLIFHDDTLQKMVFYNTSYHISGTKWNKYRGELPFGLNFDMNRSEVLNLLGKPNKYLSDIVSDSYPEKKIIIQYNCDSRDDAKIVFVYLKR